VDIVLQTPGGGVDAVEKFITVLQKRLKSYRVIVPSIAKSGGTVIALSADKILLGVNSELGPIDPQMFVPDIGMVPCELISKDVSQPKVVRDMAKIAVKRMQDLAAKHLKKGMMSGKAASDIASVVKKISTPSTYGSHGAVIDYSEAHDLGFSVEMLEDSSTLWRRIWLLYCLYDYDTTARHIGKICEGTDFSIARRASN